MKEEILELIARSSGGEEDDATYEYYDIDDDRWVDDNESRNEFESIIERDFDVHGKHKIIRTTKQIIIIGTEYGYSQLDMYMIENENTRRLSRAHGAYLEDIIIGDNANAVDTTVIVKLSRISENLTLAVDLRYLTDKNAAIGVRIKSNQLSMRFYL